jgi:hypothetical protein
MTKSDKIREYFRKHPNTDVAAVASKFEASKPMVYKLRGQVVQEWQPPEMVPMPEVVSESLKAILDRKTETGVDETLDARAQDYGRFKDGAALMQGIKRLISEHARVHDKTFADDQWEALEMIVHKIGRIVNGNPDKVDSWVDIAGYATLIADRLQGNAR